MKVIIARHAKTNENAGEIIIGQESEVLLNEEGVLQANKLADFLRKETIRVAYVSPQKRAVHTGREVLANHPKVKLIHAPHLKEQNLGIYEALGKAEWKEIKKQAKDPFHLFKPPQGESYLELQKRARVFFDYLMEFHEHDTVFMVSHGGTLGVLYLDLFGKELTEENYRAHKPENTAVTILEISKNSPIKVHKLNSLEHLD
ncbi:MAG: hypothetical protein A3D44_03225 [Candidatus Staskawiczbacteria bacterium RIFCSPHIGHO2_02_FULL_42_22]|uniref:Phosphoglycerate mutase n=1 Tax=Candidatus Staskawiczbacteria bacterium RIFCSPHIGHO2_02_FULL_42_22 TaxID=1802207 RepID=A0A1G2I4Y9_9BACT|nr:MAG: hypothetical protein A3D44_03225 [Candidatus Staskawiczbacteria bacterium RIFCSPHIGHO2_02_FULL_42_22]